MPKMKTHRGMAKRIKVTGTGRLKRGTYCLLYTSPSPRDRG